MPQNNKHNDRQNESGNVFLFILLGVVLFAALSFSIARGFNSSGTTAMSARKAELAASEIMDYAQRISREVDNLRRTNISEKEIDFSSTLFSRHASSGINQWNSNPNCVDDSCRVFSSKGGKVNEKTFENYADTLTLPFSSTHPRQGNPAFYKTSVLGVGTDAEDLVLLIVKIKENVCDQINNKLNLPKIGDQSTEAWQSFGQTAFATGGYWNLSNTISSEPLFDEETALQGVYQGCYKQNSYGTTFYKVLIAR